MHAKFRGYNISLAKHTLQPVPTVPQQHPDNFFSSLPALSRVSICVGLGLILKVVLVCCPPDAHALAPAYKIFIQICSTAYKTNKKQQQQKNKSLRRFSFFFFLTNINIISRTYNQARIEID